MPAGGSNNHDGVAGVIPESYETPTFSFTNPHTVTGTGEVIGKAIGQDLLSNMGWPSAELVAYPSADWVGRPGDVLGSGMCGGGLAELWGRNGLKIPPPLETGDVVRMASVMKSET